MTAIKQQELKSTFLYTFVIFPALTAGAVGLYGLAAWLL
ncbi:hypothetical protein [Photobacterium sp. OFAV2-7]|nr:hypothetical protein [Photobacterium sp. OFAV2-7]MCG7587794.1 hypothetical protein [Photobacterium sp. OFAV2-7]